MNSVSSSTVAARRLLQVLLVNNKKECYRFLRQPFCRHRRPSYQPPTSQAAIMVRCDPHRRNKQPHSYITMLLSGLLAVTATGTSTTEQAYHGFCCLEDNDNKEDNGENSKEDMFAKVQQLKEEFRKHHYDDLDALYRSLGRQDVDHWAKKVYLDLVRGKEYAIRLNTSRRNCLETIKKLVNVWEEYNFAPEFEEVMVRAFPRSKIVEILRICLAMDKAHALYALKNADTDKYGYHWYSKLHFVEGSEFMKRYGNDVCVREMRDAIQQYEAQQPKQKPPMNKRYYHLLFSEKLGLQHIEEFRRLVQPELAEQVKRFDPKVQGDEVVFLSHTGSDEISMHFAARIKKKLVDGGMSPFFDENSLKGGDPWRQVIEDRVKTCQIFVCFISPNYFFRHWCMHELDVAMRHNRYIIPVYVECQPPEVDSEFSEKFLSYHNRTETFEYGTSTQPSEELLRRWLDNIRQLKRHIQGIRRTSRAKESLNFLEEDLLEAIERVSNSPEM